MRGVRRTKHRCLLFSFEEDPSRHTHRDIPRIDTERLRHNGDLRRERIRFRLVYTTNSLEACKPRSTRNLNVGLREHCKRALEGALFTDVDRVDVPEFHSDGKDSAEVVVIPEGSQGVERFNEPCFRLLIARVGGTSCTSWPPPVQHEPVVLGLQQVARPIGRLGPDAHPRSALEHLKRWLGLRRAIGRQRRLLAEHRIAANPGVLELHELDRGQASERHELQREHRLNDGRLAELRELFFRVPVGHVSTICVEGCAAAAAERVTATVRRQLNSRTMRGRSPGLGSAPAQRLHGGALETSPVVIAVDSPFLAVPQRDCS